MPVYADENLKVSFGKCEIHLHGQPLDGTSEDHRISECQPATVLLPFFGRSPITREAALLGKLWASRKEKESLLVSLWTSRKENGSLLVRRSSCGASGDDDWGLLGSRSRRKSKR
jgi:hypothetical protein